MPEGPECRRIAESVAKFCSNKTLSGIEIMSGRYIKGLPSGLELAQQSFPLGVVGVGVHGKFIYWILRDEYSIWNTLGMSGSWRTELTDHARVKFVFSNGDHLYFTDQRNFGTLKFVKGKHQLIEKLKSLGPDMLAEDVSDELFISRLRKKNKHNVCKVLMDQSIIAGVGNYLKSDSLWLARINPHRLIENISDNELCKLNNSIKQVIKESYKAGGATIKTYQNINGEIGQYSSRFLVYNRKTDPDGNKIIREMNPDGRKTHWSPEIQK